MGGERGERGVVAGLFRVRVRARVRVSLTLVRFSLTLVRVDLTLVRFRLTLVRVDLTLVRVGLTLVRVRVKRGVMAGLEGGMLRTEGERVVLLLELQPPGYGLGLG